MIAYLPPFLACVAMVAARPLLPRAVDALNEEATAEAHQRDDTATRAFSNVQIQTSDGRCLFVDELSGDFRANLTPIQVANCGSTDGQGWDIITQGEHINAANSMLIVSTLTQACANFDPRRAAGDQVNLFSCGGRADGGGSVTNSQEFGFNGGAGPQQITPGNQQGSCFTVNGNRVDIAACNQNDPNQSFIFGGGAADAAAAQDDPTQVDGSDDGTLTSPEQPIESGAEEAANGAEVNANQPINGGAASEEDTTDNVTQPIDGGAAIDADTEGNATQPIDSGAAVDAD